jgi:uroporphyrinogen-III synthase
LAREFELAIVPCMERLDRPWPPWPAAPLVFVTSAWVARRVRLLTLPRGARVAALRPACAAVLPEADATAEGGAVALARAVSAWATPPVEILYPTSEKGLKTPEQAEAVAMLEGLGPVHRHVLYETRAPFGLADALSQHRGDGFVFFSPSAVEHFLAAGGEASRVICVGASTARAWPGPGPIVATSATVRAVLAEQIS